MQNNIDTILLALILIVSILTYLRGWQVSGHTRRKWRGRKDKVKSFLTRKKG